MSNYTLTTSRSKIVSKLTKEGVLEVDLSRASLTHTALYRVIGYGLHAKAKNELADLLEIGMLISYADKYFLRGERENWCRNITIQTTLRNPEKFETIRERLELTLNVLGGDNITFNITQASPAADVTKVKFKEKKTDLQRLESLRATTNIALISGGQDSSIAAIEYFKSGKVPYFVRVNTHDKANPKARINEARSKFTSKRCFYLNQEYPNLELDTDTERSQRLRSFFFLVTGTAISRMLDVGELNINENGIMATHLPLDPSRSSTFSTRTAYPPYLKYLESVIQEWLDFPEFRIKNKLLNLTKKEVIDISIKNGLPVIANESVSCAHSAIVQRVANIHKSKSSLILSTGEDLHCGYCFPCILRRVSMHEAGLGDNDADYLTDPFGEMFFDTDTKDFDFLHESKSAVLSLIRFSSFFLTSYDSAILARYPQIYEIAGVMGDAGKIKEVIDLHVRFANEVKSYIEKKSRYLAFFYDDVASKKAEIAIQKIASISHVSTYLKAHGVEDWNEHFAVELEKMYAVVKFKVLVAIGNNVITEENVKNFFYGVLDSYLPKNLAARKKISLNRDSGREIGKKTEGMCTCSIPPATGKKKR